MDDESTAADPFLAHSRFSGYGFSETIAYLRISKASFDNEDMLADQIILKAKGMLTFVEVLLLRRSILLEFDLFELRLRLLLCLFSRLGKVYANFFVSALDWALSIDRRLCFDLFLFCHTALLVKLFLMDVARFFLIYKL